MRKYDLVETLEVMQALREQGGDETYIETLEDIYKDYAATIMLFNSGELLEGHLESVMRSQRYE